MPEVGLAGQRKLARSSVLCVGTGGLGSPASLYLAAAGVGRIGLLDSDTVDETNLHRQILFRSHDVGAPKAQVARETLAALNPDVELVIHQARLTAENADALLSGYDVILDGTDNFPTRYLINETCARLGKPDVWASVFRFEGQVAVFDARKGPCYRCLFPEIPPSEEIPACAEAGVLGVLPGVLGTTQALEAIKLLLGIGQPLIGRLLFFDALGLSWSELSFEKDPACPTCGTSADLADRPIPAARSLELPEESVTALDPDELQQRLEEDATVVVIDCREPFEWEICQIPGSRLVPLRTLTEGLSDLHKETPLVIVCHHGPRALHAASYLLQAGFSDVSYLEGGLHAWALHVDPRMPRY